MRGKTTRLSGIPRAGHGLVLAVVFALGLAVVGCGSETATTTTTSGAIELTVQTPAPTGPVDLVNWNLSSGEPASLDYVYAWDAGSASTVLANLCESLMRQNPDGSIVPGLAQSVSTPDDTTYVYDLRPGVTFADGQPVTVDDVVFSLSRHLDPDVFSYWGLMYANVDSIEATSPTQVTIHMTAPDALFGSMMALPAGAIAQRAYVEAQGADYGTPAGGVMCTGPYTLNEWVAGKSITLEANPNYWDTSLEPKVDTFVFTFLRDPATITNGLLTGSIDGTWMAPLSGYPQLKAATNGTLYVNVGTRVGIILMASFDGALSDLRVRQALQAVIDYDGIVRGVLQGLGEPAAAFPSRATWGYERDAFAAAYAALPPATQNLEAAAALLAEAGVPSQPIVLAADAGDELAVNTVTSIQNSAQGIGLPVEIRTFSTSDFQVLLFDPNSRQGIDGVFSSTATDIADPLELYAQGLPGSPYDWTGLVNPGFSDPITQAVGVSDPVQRAQLVIQGQASFQEQVQILPIWYLYERLFMNERITGPAVSTLGYLYFPWAATVGAA